jgi:phenylpyruvate tautomerase PptA (4-oxalocrotonate tautomerase family)
MRFERSRKEITMPVAYVDVPPGLSEAAKKKVFTELHDAIHEAWPIPDTRVMIREWPNLAVSLDGRIENVPMRPIVTLAVPPGLPVAGKRKVIKRISDVLGEICHREVEEVRLPSGTKFRTNWVLTFFWELPLDQVGLGDILASENPMVLENLPPH